MRPGSKEPRSRSQPAPRSSGLNDTLTYAYQVFKNGRSRAPFASGSGVNLNELAFTPDDNGSYQIVLTVSDRTGDRRRQARRSRWRTPAQSMITSISHPSTWIEGMTLSLGTSATDPAGSNDTLTYVYQVFKDGNAFASGSGVNQTSFAFTPDDNGSYQIVLTGPTGRGIGDDEPDDRGGNAARNVRLPRSVTLRHGSKG